MFDVLIVEDNVPTTLLLKSILKRKFQCNIKSVSNGYEALNYILTEKPDLILLDYLMPEMDGYEFLKKIRDNKNLSNIPVIIVSAVNEKNMVRKMKNLGINDYLLKPIDLNVTIDRIAKIMSDRNKNLRSDLEKLKRRLEALEKQNINLKKEQIDIENNIFKISLN